MLVVPATGGRTFRRVFTASGFIVWFALATFAASTLTGWHAVMVNAQHRAALAPSNLNSGWHVRHYLSADCGHSWALARYLIKRHPMTPASEEVILVGSNAGRRSQELLTVLSRARFQVKVMTAETAAGEGIEAVPTLEVIAPDGQVRFRGGYRTAAALNEGYLDVAIVSGLMGSRPIPAPKVYGCAISPRLRAQLSFFHFHFLQF